MTEMMNGAPYSVRRSSGLARLADKVEEMLERHKAPKDDRISYAEARKIVDEAVAKGQIKRPKERVLNERICQHCGKKFMGLFANYCSSNCKPSKRRKTPPKMGACVVCGAEFSKFRRHKTCSHECGEKHMRTTSRERDKKRRKAIEK